MSASPRLLFQANRHRGLGKVRPCLQRIRSQPRICAWRQIMRTTLELDETALRGAMSVAKGKTKTAVINEALRDFARRRSLRQLLAFSGALR